MEEFKIGDTIIAHHPISYDTRRYKGFVFCQDSMRCKDKKIFTTQMKKYTHRMVLTEKIQLNTKYDVFSHIWTRF